MNKNSFRRAGPLGLVATVGLAATLAAAGPAHASKSASASASASIVGTTLNINGSSAPDDIVLSIASTDPTTLLVDFGNDGTIDQQFARDAVDAINVSLGTGDDRFSANGVAMSQTSTIDGGSGADTIVGTAGNDVITGGSGADNISSGAGLDVIDSGSGADFVAGGLGHDVASLGSGDDTFLWNNGEGSDDVDGGSGNDNLVFNGAGNETSTLSAVGTCAVFARVQGNIQMNLDGVEQLDLHALGGVDNITVNDTTGTSLRQANIDLSASGNDGAGDGMADVVTVNGTSQDDHVNVVGQGTQVDVSGLRPETRITGSEAGLDQLHVNTLDGNDTVTVDPSAQALIGVTPDLGAGQL